MKTEEGNHNHKYNNVIKEKKKEKTIGLTVKQVVIMVDQMAGSLVQTEDFTNMRLSCAV